MKKNLLKYKKNSINFQINIFNQDARFQAAKFISRGPVSIIVFL